jgi:hypothetical protein
MSEKKRVVFTFDARSMESLETLKERGRLDSLADAVRNSLQVSRALQQQKELGYTEVVVRNPETKEERILVIPNL